MLSLKKSTPGISFEYMSDYSFLNSKEENIYAEYHFSACI